jgi:[acyl-carrier-protein] S-malonyltransferase
MLHHVLRNCPEAVNQRDPRGFTPLHRAAYLAQYDGYMELYEYLLTEGADPTIRTNDYDPYLNPGLKTSIQVAIDDEEIRGKLIALHEKYAHVPKRPEPHKDLSDWWACYDYGFDTVRKWPKDFQARPVRRSPYDAVGVMHAVPQGFYLPAHLSAQGPSISTPNLDAFQLHF